MNAALGKTLCDSSCDCGGICLFPFPLRLLHCRAMHNVETVFGKGSKQCDNIQKRT